MILVSLNLAEDGPLVQDWYLKVVGSKLSTGNMRYVGKKKRVQTKKK